MTYEPEQVVEALKTAEYRAHAGTDRGCEEILAWEVRRLQKENAENISVGSYMDALRSAKEFQVLAESAKNLVKKLKYALSVEIHGEHSEECDCKDHVNEARELLAGNPTAYEWFLDHEKELLNCKAKLAAQSKQLTA